MINIKIICIIKLNRRVPYNDFYAIFVKLLFLIDTQLFICFQVCSTSTCVNTKEI